MRKSLPTPRNSGLTLIEILAALAIISASLLLIIPNLGNQPRTGQPELVAFLKQQRAQAILKGRSNVIIYQDNQLRSELTFEKFDPGPSTALRITAPEPSRFLPYQEVSIFYPDGTAIVGDFAVVSKSVEREDQILYKVSINPFDATITHYVP